MAEITTSNLSVFYNAAQRQGFAKDNLFRLIQIGDGGLSFLNKDQSIYLKTATLPSRTIKTTKVYYKSFGLNVPLGAVYPESANWRATFYSDKNYRIRELFEQWSKNIYNESTFNRTIETNGILEFELCKQTGNPLLEVKLQGKGNNSTIWLNGAKDDRQPAEKIGGPELKPVRRYILRGCFPVNIGSILYNTTSTGNIASIDVTFAYQYFEGSYNVN